jgi:hypothetical protein
LTGGLSLGVKPVTVLLTKRRIVQIIIGRSGHRFRRKTTFAVVAAAPALLAVFFDSVYALTVARQTNRTRGVHRERGSATGARENLLAKFITGRTAASLVAAAREVFAIAHTHHHSKMVGGVNS